MSDIWACS